MKSWKILNVKSPIFLATRQNSFKKSLLSLFFSSRFFELSWRSLISFKILWQELAKTAKIFFNQDSSRFSKDIYDWWTWVPQTFTPIKQSPVKNIIIWIKTNWFVIIVLLWRITHNLNLNIIEILTKSGWKTGCLVAETNAIFVFQKYWFFIQFFLKQYICTVFWIHISIFYIHKLHALHFF